MSAIAIVLGVVLLFLILFIFATGFSGHFGKAFVGVALAMVVDALLYKELAPKHDQKIIEALRSGKMVVCKGAVVGEGFRLYRDSEDGETFLVEKSSDRASPLSECSVLEAEPTTVAMKEKRG